MRVQLGDHRGDRVGGTGEHDDVRPPRCQLVGRRDLLDGATPLRLLARTGVDVPSADLPIRGAQPQPDGRSDEPGADDPDPHAGPGQSFRSITAARART